MAKTSTRMKIRNWRWDQHVEGNAAVFDAILYDNTTGVEVATRKPSRGGGGGEPRNGFRKRYTGSNRPFAKAGRLVFARDECGGGVGWRLSKEMEGSVLKWRIGGRVWLSYWPNDVKSSYFETRCVEWSTAGSPRSFSCPFMSAAVRLTIRTVLDTAEETGTKLFD
ncbi:hypothetical protein F0562_028725 [Nyssa sinensis]|uniref:Uncharacterized protein n=1 Tax=Nyssa sinensis TaxID=561372 RepID=A0A5J5B384_9ASTE|nr:hypothetical protein F0562_028725 [Nyssa sinensis]